MRIVITTTLNDNLFHAKLMPLVNSRPDLKIVVVSDREGAAHDRIQWVCPKGIWKKLGRLGGRIPLLARAVFHPRTRLVMAYSVVPHGLFAVALAKVRRIPVFLHFIAGPAEIEFAHNVEVSDNRVILRSKHPERLERIAKYVSRRADKVFVPGSNTERVLLHNGFRPERIIRLHSTIDPARFYPGNDTRDIDVLVSAQLRERKRPIFTLEVFRRILDQRPHSRFCWLGDGGMREEFSAALDRLGLRDSVIWTHTNDVAPYYRRAKVFLLCSINEGLSLASMEAMGCGMSPVTADCGDMVDTVKNGETGFLLPIEAPAETYAEKVLELLSDNRIWANRSKNSVRIIEAEHSFPVAEYAWKGILAGLERS